MLNLTIAYLAGSWFLTIKRVFSHLFCKATVVLILVLVPIPIFPTLALAQGNKSTQTPTVTPTATPTVTSTDSLDVFETPATPTRDPQEIFISNPVEGSLVQGTVNIVGKTDVNGFSGYELEFTYDPNTIETWFLIARSTERVNDGQLATWDTSNLTDGDYLLRLRVFFQDGSWRDYTTPSIKVRNYTATQTTIPTKAQSILPTSLPTLISTSTSTAMPTPSPFPRNEAEISMSQVLTNLGQGALFTLLIFVFFALILRSRNRRNK